MCYYWAKQDGTCCWLNCSIISPAACVYLRNTQMDAFRRNDDEDDRARDREYPRYNGGHDRLEQQKGWSYAVLRNGREPRRYHRLPRSFPWRFRHIRPGSRIFLRGDLPGNVRVDPLYRPYIFGTIPAQAVAVIGRLDKTLGAP